jgi:hypothetical protein
MKVVIEFYLPEEFEKYADAMNGTRYRKIIEEIEKCFDEESLKLISYIKRDILAGDSLEKTKSMEQDSKDS